MLFSSSILVVAAVALDCAFASPAGSHLHRRLHRLDLAAVLHGKRQDWSDPALYKDVNWATVNYGGAAAAAPAATPAPAPAPAASPAPVAQQEKAVASPQTTNNAQSNTNTNTNTNANANSGDGKRGLAYNPSSPNLNIFDSYGKITWAYNWDSLPAGLPTKYQYVPMLFSNSPGATSNWNANAKAATSGSGTHYLMSFNEPDIAAQANMDVGAAVAAFNQWMTPLASDNVKLGSPAVSNSVSANQGLNWLKSFLQQCSGCPISFAPVHWYGCQGSSCSTEADVSAFKTQMQQAMDTAVVNGQKVPIWVTEFQSFTNQEQFMAEVLPWLDSQSQVQRYSYFMASSVALTSGNSVSSLGQTYGST